MKNVRLGGGSYGKVYKIKLVGDDGKEDKRSYALKINTKHRDIDLCACYRELDIQRNITHPHVLRLYGCYNEQCAKSISSPISQGKLIDNMCFLMEYAVHGDLWKFMKTPMFTDEVARRFTWQILLALEYVHSLGIAHRDIKPGNILVVDYNGRPHAKLSDFGMSRYIPKYQESDSNLYTDYYKPIEALVDYKYCGTKSDIWSVGIVFYEMITGHYLLSQKSGKDLDRRLFAEIMKKLPFHFSNKEFQQIARRKFFCLRSTVLSWEEFFDEENCRHPSLEKHLPWEWRKSFITATLNPIPSKRHTATQLLDEFFPEKSRLITHYRNEYKPKPELPYVISTSPQRHIGVEVLKKLQDMSVDRQVMFHSLHLFDRFINVAQGMSNEDVEVYTYGCIFLSLKYFADIPNPEVHKLHYVLPHRYNNYRVHDMLSTFEPYLVSEVCDNSIYQPSPYTYLFNDRKAEEEDVLGLYNFLLRGDHDGMTARQAYDFWNSRSRSN